MPRQPKRKPKKKPASRARVIKQEFDVDLTLLEHRQIFLMEEVNIHSARRIIKELYALDTANNNPIMLYINSGGGDCSAGLSIINTMFTIDSPIITIIKGEALSIAGHISISGAKRACYSTSSWMEHPVETYFEGSPTNMKERTKFMDSYEKLLSEHLREHTNLSEKEIKKAQGSELWLFADEMLEKGVVDHVFTMKKVEEVEEPKKPKKPRKK